MSTLILPKGYKSALTGEETERAIQFIKDHFQLLLSAELNLVRVTAPIVVERGTGINDDLNGTERPVSFPVKALQEATAEVVHSLAKWKRWKLSDLKYETGKGIYTDMNALRPDEDVSNIHSIYVDQWDWEKTISEEERTLEYLKKTVVRIYDAIRKTELLLSKNYSGIKAILPEKIVFIHAEDLRAEFPTFTSREREDQAAKKYGAVFVVGIGGKLSDGKEHDGRAPDYDDWTTISEGIHKGLNGDIVVWNPLLERSFELSSMGIRVSKESLLEQLKLTGQEQRIPLKWHQQLLKGELPFTIGGGIGQSRLCMFLLKKAHIGEVQSSIWPVEVQKVLKEKGIKLL